MMPRLETVGSFDEVYNGVVAVATDAEAASPV
jgi:hypothetical protein